VRWPFLVIILAAIVYGIVETVAPSPSVKRAAIEACRRAYASAHTLGDTLVVDGYTVSSRRLAAYTRCRDYRLTGMR